MRIDRNAAIIPVEKLRDYLLSPTHPTGRHKAAFFNLLGYRQPEWRRLERDLRAMLALDAEFLAPSEFGERFVIRGAITGPADRSARVVTIWTILFFDSSTRFVTAYPED